MTRLLILFLERKGRGEFIFFFYWEKSNEEGPSVGFHFPVFPFFFISPIKHGTPPFWKRRDFRLFISTLWSTLGKLSKVNPKRTRKARFVILRFESKPAASRNFNRGENATDLCKFARCPPRRVFTLGSVQPDYLENASHTSSILLERKCTDIDETVSPSSFTLLSSKRLKKKEKKFTITII